MKILAISGSLQTKSKNVALLLTAQRSAPTGVELVVFDGLRDLPPFNPDMEAAAAPESVVQWRHALASSNAVLIASPEYGFSLPGVLKNAIDWVIGSGELEGKVVAVTAAVPGPECGRRGLRALCDTLSAVRAEIVGGEPIQIGPEFERRVATLVGDLVLVISVRATSGKIAGRVPATRSPELGSSEPTPAEVQYLEDRIYEFNSAVTGIADGDWLAIFVRDGHRIVAGICGNTWGGCAEIRQFWVDESRRKQGLGTQLLAAAEREAQRRGCRQMLLMTFSFQAPAFYAKHGFEVVAVVDDHPRGHKNMLLRKRLAVAS